MRRQGGHYRRPYGQFQQQQQENNRSSSDYYQERQLEKESHHHQQHQNQWQRWERDGGGGGAQSKLPQSSMSPTPPFVEGQGREDPRSYYQNQRLDSRKQSEKQGGGDPRSQPHEEDMDIGYEDNPVQRTYEGLEQRFLDEIMKLSKEQTDAEDAENARHRERLNVINTQYEEQLVSLRARHAGRREEFLRRESQARQQQYQQLVAIEQYPTSGIDPNDPPRGSYAPVGEPHGAYNSDYHDSYRERGRFPGNVRDHGFEPKVPYPRGRSYDTGSRYH